jgi:hypothetical protein
MRFLAILATALAMWAPAVAAAKQPWDSIKTLGDLHADGTKHEFCTVWHTKVGPQNIGLWVGKAHCLVLEDGEVYRIDGVEATLIGVNADLDLAMFSGGPSAPGLKVGYGPTPDTRTPVYTIGYPGKGTYYDGWVYAEGIVSNPSVGVSFKDQPGVMVKRALYQFPAGPGASGAPIMVKGDIVVGVLEGGPSPWAGFTVATRLQDLRLFLFGE